MCVCLPLSVRVPAYGTSRMQCLQHRLCCGLLLNVDCWEICDGCVGAFGPFSVTVRKGTFLDVHLDVQHPKESPAAQAPACPQ